MLKINLKKNLTYFKTKNILKNYYYHDIKQYPSNFYKN